MRSSSGEHYVALDHVRALAALLVFVWHFTHAGTGYPVPFEYVPPLPLFFMSVLDEGHTGVALFMSLSGYLFARLLNNKKIHYGWFLWNRSIRLLPLLVLVIAVAGALEGWQGKDLRGFWESVRDGWYRPTLPNGGWSITVEFHYYLVLPLLLWLLRRSRWLPIGVVAVAMALRYSLWARNGEIQTLAYATLLGRIDQFVLGMLAFHFRTVWVGRHFRVWSLLAVFALFYWYFDRKGGFYLNPHFPSGDWLWVVMPTIEGITWGAFIAWYDGSFAHDGRGRLSQVVAALGAYSYSIYLTHFFVVFQMARLVHQHVADLSNFYVACAWALVGFCCMLPVGHASYRLVEEPCLALRRRYIISRPWSQATTAP